MDQFCDTAPAEWVERQIPASLVESWPPFRGGLHTESREMKRKEGKTERGEIRSAGTPGWCLVEEDLRPKPSDLQVGAPDGQEGREVEVACSEEGVRRKGNKGKKWDRFHAVGNQSWPSVNLSMLHAALQLWGWQGDNLEKQCCLIDARVVTLTRGNNYMRHSDKGRPKNYKCPVRKAVPWLVSGSFSKELLRRVPVENFESKLFQFTCDNPELRCMKRVKSVKSDF